MLPSTGIRGHPEFLPLFHIHFNTPQESKIQLLKIELFILAPNHLQNLPPPPFSRFGHHLLSHLSQKLTMIPARTLILFECFICNQRPNPSASPLSASNICSLPSYLTVPGFPNTSQQDSPNSLQQSNPHFLLLSE